MQRQGSCAGAAYGAGKKPARLVGRLALLYPTGERGRPVLAKAGIPLERMLRVYFVQQWQGLSDQAVAGAFGACPRA